jgi:hypothetical protein
MNTTRSSGLVVGITSVLGAAAFWRRHQKQKVAPELSPAGGGADPAEELRARLAESRATENAVAPDEPAPLAAADADASPLDPEARRKNVHDRARASIDELQ